MVPFPLVSGWFYKWLCLAGMSLEENVLDRTVAIFTLSKHLIWRCNTSCKAVEEIPELFHSYFQRCSFSHWWESIHVLSVLLFWLIPQSCRAWMWLEVEKAEVAELPLKQSHWAMLCKVYDVDLCYISCNKVAGSYWRGTGPHLSCQAEFGFFSKTERWKCLIMSILLETLWVRVSNLDIVLLSSLIRTVVCHNALPPSLLWGRHRDCSGCRAQSSALLICSAEQLTALETLQVRKSEKFQLGSLSAWETFFFFLN